jgi:protein O-GlcNAc transferase
MLPTSAAAFATPGLSVMSAKVLKEPASASAMQSDAKSQSGLSAKQHFEAAVLLHNQGKLDEAERHYRAVLELQPDHLGTLRRLAFILIQDRRFAEAAQIYERVVAIDPGDALARANFGQLLLSVGRPERALAQLEASIALKPESAETHTNLGNALARLNRPEEALASYRRALELNPHLPEPHNNAGNVLSSLGRVEEAVTHFERALALNPDFFTARENLANALVKLGRHDDAIAQFGLVLTSRSDLVSTHFNFGNALAELQRHKEAIEHFSRAIEARPQFASAFSNMANSLDQIGRSGEALVAYDKALSLDPKHALAYFGRAGIMRRVGRFEESYADYDKAAALAPDFVEAKNMRFNLAALLCDWRGREASVAELRCYCREGRNISPFELLWMIDEPEIHLLAAQGKAGPSKPGIVTAARAAHDRLRVAYLSSDFCEHPVAYQAVEVLERHDKSRFEIYGISLKSADESVVRQRLKRAFDHFEDIGERTDREIAELLAGLEIDIAVDLNGHTSLNRTKSLAFRPAPIAVNYLGYPGTTGADYIDYILADAHVIPQASEADYTETVVRLPNCFMPRDTRIGRPGSIFSRVEAGLPDQGFVFCAFNNSGKLNPRMFDIWMRLLRAIENSVLWLNVDNPTAIKNLCAEASARDVRPERLVFAQRVPARDAYLSRLACADLYLDTHPYGAHTTASDMLWAGVPVLTAPGKSFASRVAGSMLSDLGLNEMIADGLGEYERKAVDLARSPEQLVAIRMKLAELSSTSALFDMSRLCRNVERAYETMWELYKSGRPPHSFSVTPARDHMP